MFKSALKWFAGWAASHVANILFGGAFLVILGFVIGFAGEMAEMMGLFPAPFAVACLCSCGLGIIIHAVYDRVAAFHAKSRMMKAIKGLPLPAKKLLYEVYKEGEVWGNIRDPRFHQLCKMRFLQGPPQFEILQGDAFILTQEANAFISDNESELFAGFAPEADEDSEKQEVA